MITLGPVQSLAAAADTANVVNCFLEADTITPGATPPDLFGGRGPLLLGTTAQVLLAATAGQQVLVKSIALYSAATAPVAVAFYSNGTAAANQRYGLTLPAGGSAAYEDGRGWVVYDVNGLAMSSLVPLDVPLPVNQGGTGATALATNSLLVGNGADPVLAPAALSWDGSLLNAPGLDLTGSAIPQNGLYLAGSDVLGVASGGAEVGSWSAAGLGVLLGGNPPLGALSVSAAAAGGTALSIQGLAAQTGGYSRVSDSGGNVLQALQPVSGSDPRARQDHYNTLEATPTNYERVSLYFDNPNNVARLETQSGGTGTLRALALQAGGGRTLVGGTIDDGYTALQVIGSLGVRGTNYVVAVPGVASTVDRVDWMAQSANKGVNFNLFPNGTSSTASIVMANQNSQTNFGSAYLKLIGATAYVACQSVGSPTTPVTSLVLGTDPTVGRAWTTISEQARVLIGPALPTDDGSTALQVNGAGRFAPGSASSSALNFGTANTGLYGVSSTAFAATVGGVPTVTFNANNIQVQDAAGANTTKNFRLFQTTYGGTNPFTLFVSNSSSNPSNGVTFGGGTALGEPASFVRFNVGAPGTLGSGTTALEVIQTGGIPRIGINIATGAQTAQLHIGAGTATVATAPFKLSAGTNLTTPEAGAHEYDGNQFYKTPSTAVRTTVQLGKALAAAIGAGTYAVLQTDSDLVFSAACTVTLLAAGSYPGKALWLQTQSANAVVSASANVVPLGGGAAGTAILPAASGKWVRLVATVGGNWQIMAAN